MILVSDLPQQRLGPLTNYWKGIVPLFKTYPLNKLLLICLLISLLLWFIFNTRIVTLVSILQYGF